MWYYMHNNQRIGPVDENIIHALIRNGTVDRETAVWKEGMQSWSLAGTTELQTHFGRVPPTPPPYHGPTVRYTSVPAYSPGSFKTLWLWFAWLAALGLPLSAVIIGLPLLMAATVISCILLYRFWHIIQGGAARTSPGKAVGLCFIPFFNVYWCYVAIVGLAEDVNGYCDQRNIEGPRVSERLALAWYMLSLLNTLFSLLCQLIIGTRFTSEWLLLFSLTLAPYVGLLIAIVVVWIVLYKQFVEIAMQITAASACGTARSLPL